MRRPPPSSHSHSKPSVGELLDDANGLFVAAGSFVVGADSEASLRAQITRIADDYVVGLQAAAAAES